VQPDRHPPAGRSSPIGKRLVADLDLYEGLAVKQVKFLCSAEGCFSVPA
jgi:hypothetical protein